MKVPARLEEAWRWLEPRLRELPRPTPLQLLKVSPLIVGAVVMAALLLRNHDIVDLPDYEVPEGFVVAPPPTAVGPPAPLLALGAAVPGTTVEVVPANVGTSALEGTVQGPAGGVPGAVVRIERTILGQVQGVDVLADAAGQWRAEGIGGGRYRVRAFLPPTLASRAAEVFVLPAGERRSVDLTVEEFTSGSVSLASAPAPALLGQPVNVGVLVTRRTVDGDGFVVTEPVVGVPVELSVPASWVRSGAGAVTTGGDGQATFTFTCRQAGQVSVVATVRIGGTVSTPTTTGTTVAGAPPPSPPTAPLTAQATFECIDPATLATTTTQPGDGITPLPTTTAPGGTTTTFPDVGD